MSRKCLLVLVAALVLGACGDDVATSATSTTAVTVSTTTTAKPTTTTAPPKPEPRPSPDAAAVALVDAWRGGDKRAARVVASQKAVKTIFGRPAAPLTSRGCQEPLDNATDCTFSTADHSLLVNIHLVGSPAGWLVDSVTFLS